MQLSKGIQRYRKLEMINLSRAGNFTDTGLTSLLTAGSRVLKSFNLSGCKDLSSFSLVGVRNQMPLLTALNISQNHFSASTFEWIAEGCRSLTSLNLMESSEFTDASLQLIGRKCSNLLKLNISKCYQITDSGIKGFIDNFTGKLEFLDISNNLDLTGETTAALSYGASELLEIRMNGIGKILNPGLQMLWDAAKKLVKFEMYADLKAATGHRVTVLPHISDIILMNGTYSLLQSVKISGAVLVTDEGACVMIQKCSNLRVLDLSHCHKITNLTLKALSKYAKKLSHLNISVCNKITDTGLQSIGSSCLELIELQLNGIKLLQDESLKSISNLKKLQVLCIKNCTYITNKPLLRIIKNCRKLHTLDIGGLEFVTIEVITEAVLKCSYLTALNAEGCNILPNQFANAVKFSLPLANYQLGRCRLDLRDPTVIEYNKYVIELREKQHSAKILSRFCKKISKYVREIILNKRKERAIEVIKQVYNLYLQRISVRKSKIIQLSTKRAASKIAKFFRRKWNIYLRKRIFRRIRLEIRCIELIQKHYRGHMIRKRAAVKRMKYLNSCIKLQHLSWKLLGLECIRKLQRKIVKIQANIRRFGKRLNYLLFKQAIIKLQIIFRNYCKRLKIKEEKMKQDMVWREVSILAVQIIEKNWLIHKYNSTMSSYILFCAEYATLETREIDRQITNVQRVWRGYWIRLNLSMGFVKRPFINGVYRSKYKYARRIQSLWRSHYSRRLTYPFITKIRKFHFKWRQFTIIKRCRLLIGQVIKEIQRWYRYWRNQKKLISFVITIQSFFRCILAKKVYKSLKKERAERYNAMLMNSLMSFIRFLRRRFYRKRRERAARTIQVYIFTNKIHCIYFIVFYF